jgi:hypothetical protein
VLVALVALGACAAGAGCVDPDGDYESFRADTETSRGAKPALPGAGGAAGAGGSSAGGSSAGGSSAGGAGGGAGVALTSGTFTSFCLSTLAGGDPTKALVFKTELEASGSKVSIGLTPLKAKSMSFADVVGAKTTKDGTLNADGTFSINFGNVAIPGVANPISGSDIEVGNTTFKARVLSNDRLCAELDGQLVKPFNYSLDPPGDVCIILRAPEGGFPTPPAANDYLITCP